MRSSDGAVLEAIAAAEALRPLEATAQAKFRSDRRTLAGRLEQYSQVAAVARRAVRTFLEASGLRATGWDRSRTACHRTPGACEVFENAALRTLFTPAYRWVGLDPSDPRIREGERIALDALVRLDQRVRDAGGRFVVLGVPTKERAFAESLLPVQGASDDLLRVVEAERMLAARTAAALGERGVRFVDAAPALAEALNEGVACYRESTDGHPAPEGHRVLAAALEPWVTAAE
jgi:hypothetical protein